MRGTNSRARAKRDSSAVPTERMIASKVGSGWPHGETLLTDTGVEPSKTFFMWIEPGGLPLIKWLK